MEVSYPTCTMSILQDNLDYIAGDQLRYIKNLMSNDPYASGVKKMTPPRPGPKFRVITDQGAEFIVEAIDFDLNFSYGGALGNRLRLSGKILSPTDLPGFVQPEAERRITIPD